MTNEQKAAVQKAALAAARSVEQRDTPIATAIERSSVAKWFKAGAQTILENPGEWGLTYPHSQKLAEEVLAMESQLAKYREALEKFANMKQTELSGYYVRGTKKYAVEEAVKVTKDVLALINHLAKEALKQEGTK